MQDGSVRTGKTVVEPLLFPCLIGSGNRLLPATKSEVLTFCIKRHIVGDRYLFKHGASPRLAVSFVIDRNGSFRQVRVLSLRHGWARPLASLNDFVLSECEIAPGERLTNAELLERMRSVKGSREFQQPKRLRAFLRRQPGDEPFDACRFRQFWEKEGPELAPEQWTERFPE